jgi:hypothetical protein
MQTGSSHLVKTPAGEQMLAARNHLDHMSAKSHYFCQHDRCEGKRWASYEEMRANHDTSEKMTKNGEVHVYGLWSDEILNSAAMKAAEAKLDEAKKYAADTAAAARKDYTQRPLAGEAAKELMAAEKAAKEARQPVGLIAPPEV